MNKQSDCDSKMLLYSGPKDACELIKKSVFPHFDVIWSEATTEFLYPLFSKCTVFVDASMKVSIPGSLIESAQNLRLIITATTGADHIDSVALDKRNIPLFTLKGQHQILNQLTAAAELSWGLVMSCSRKLKGAFQHVQQGEWERTEFPGIMLRGKTLGLIGLGRIGKCMARYGEAFEMKVIAHDPYVQSESSIPLVSLDALLQLSDIVSIHVPLNDKTKRLISSKKIELLKNGCILINTSRGAILDEAAILLAIRSGKISAVGLDVLEGEPEIRNNVLWQESLHCPEIIITPHIGGFAPEAVHKALSFSCARILDHFGIKRLEV